MSAPRIQSSTARTLTFDGNEVLAFAGCSYLGLAHHPGVKDAARAALDEHGIGALASRATSGNHELHERLEAALAELLGTETALLCTDGYLASLVPLQGLARSGQVALLDEDAHPALWDSARGAGLETFSYGAGDLNHALALMDLHSTTGPFVMTDGTFPMQGRMAELNVLLRHLPGAGTLVVDDSHGLGVVGREGRGTCDAFGLDDERIVVTASLAKALGCAGGVVAGARTRLDAGRNAPAFIGATPLAPPIAAAALAALEVLAAEPERVETLHRNTSHLHRLMRRLGQAPRGSFLPVAIIDVGSRERGEALARDLLVHGLFAPYIDYPGAPAHGVLRLSVNAEHTLDDLQRLESVLAETLGPLAEEEEEEEEEDEP